MPLSLWQAELRTLVMGDGTNYPFDAEVGIGGLGMPPPKAQQVELFHEDGAYRAADFKNVRIVTIPFILGGTPAEVFGWLDDLNTAWETTTASDVTLQLNLPFHGTLTLTGRPDGLEANAINSHFGLISAVGTFIGLDPNFA